MNEWRRLVRETRAMFPLDFPVRVSRGPRPKWASDDWEAGCLVYRDTHGKPIRALLWVQDRMSWSHSTDALHHEWAHLLALEDSCHEDMPHDDQFWITYGKLYRTWHRTD